MKIRQAYSFDRQALRDMESGFPYPDPHDGHSVCHLVVTDDSGKPIMSGQAITIVECYLRVDKDASPHAKLVAMSALHEAMKTALRDKGYNEGNAGVPPEIAGKFGRRLEKLGWRKSLWPKWFIRF